MTELQELRKILFKQLDNIEKEISDSKQVDRVVALSNSIIKSYNTELRADDLGHKIKMEKTTNNNVFGKKDVV